MVQPYITGTTHKESDLSSALSILSNIYSKNGINLSIQSTNKITENKFAEVSESFTNSITSELVEKGSADRVNIFFINDFTDSSYFGISAGIPGSQGIKGSHNGILINLNAHQVGGSLQDQLLAESIGHEMGHFLGLYHTTEAEGSLFDPISDTPQCLRSTYDTDSSGQLSAEECEQAGGNNLMFWTVYSNVSRNLGKVQDNLSSGQVYVLQHAPIAR